MHRGFLLYLSYPVTHDNTDYTVPSNFCKEFSKLNQGSLPEVCDEGVSITEIGIVLHRQKKFK